MDPVTGAAAGAYTGNVYNPLLRTSPAAPGVLVVGQLGISPAYYDVFDVVPATASVPATPVLRTELRDEGASNFQDLALTPDAAHVVVADGAPYRHQVFRVSDLGRAGSYLTTNYPNAVAIADDGTVVAGVAYGTPAVKVFEEGVADAYATIDLGGAILAARGIAVGAGRAYLVTGAGSGYTLQVHTLPTPTTPTPSTPTSSTTTPTDPPSTNPTDPPTTTPTDPSTETPPVEVPSSVELSVPRTAVAGDTVAADITISSPEPAPAVEVYVTDSDGYTHQVGTVTATDGRATADVPVTRNGKITAVYRGTTGVARSYDGVRIKVHAVVGARLAQYRRLQQGTAIYRPGDTLVIVGAIGPQQNHGCLQFLLQERRGNAWRSVSRSTCIAVTGNPSAAGGALKVTRGMAGHRYRLRAGFPGSTQNASGESNWVQARVLR